MGGGLPQLAVGQPGVIDVLADLRAGRTPLALLSNAGPDYASYFRHGPLGDFFPACYVSGELGLLKPHAEIFRHVLDDLGITPAEAVFIDNRESNVAGAEMLGITGHVFTDAARLRAFLESLAPVAPSASRTACLPFVVIAVRTSGTSRGITSAPSSAHLVRTTSMSPAAMDCTGYALQSPAAAWPGTSASLRSAFRYAVTRSAAARWADRSCPARSSAAAASSRIG